LSFINEFIFNVFRYGPYRTVLSGDFESNKRLSPISMSLMSAASCIMIIIINFIMIIIVVVAVVVYVFG